MTLTFSSVFIYYIYWLLFHSFHISSLLTLANLMHLLSFPKNSTSAAWIVKAVLLFCVHISLSYKKLVQNLNCISFRLAKTWQAWSSSLPGQQLPWLRFFKFSLSPSRQVLRQYLKLWHDTFLSHLYTNYPPIITSFCII